MDLSRQNVVALKTTGGQRRSRCSVWLPTTLGVQSTLGFQRFTIKAELDETRPSAGDGGTPKRLGVHERDGEKVQLIRRADLARHRARVSRTYPTRTEPRSSTRGGPPGREATSLTGARRVLLHASEQSAYLANPYRFDAGSKNARCQCEAGRDPAFRRRWGYPQKAGSSRTRRRKSAANSTS